MCCCLQNRIGTEATIETQWIIKAVQLVKLIDDAEMTATVGMTDEQIDEYL